MTTSPDVPARFDCAINGRPFLIDRASGQMRQWTQQVARTQADTAEKAGEQSLAREFLWRRTFTSWHRGAGQQTYDDTTGDPYRFRKSRGVDIWTPGQIKPLGGLGRKAIPAANGGHISGRVFTPKTGATTYGNQMIVWDGYGYVAGGTNNASLYLTWDTSSVVTVPNGIISVCESNGAIYLADCGAGGTGGTIYTSTGSGAGTSYKTGSYYLVRYALGRLWAANATTLVNVTSGSTETTAYTDTSTNWCWTDVVAGKGGVLASGYDSGRSSIVLVGLLPDGSSITTGYVIADMPAGEKILAMHAYLGYVILGTNKGVRVCKHDGGANFTVGPLLDLFSAQANDGTNAAPSTTGVRCFASTERFVYFGWSFYDWGGSTTGTESSGLFYAGLGRLDLSTFLAPLQPAYATDTMVYVDNDPVYTSGEVTGVAIDRYGTPTFTVDRDECYFGAIAGVPNKSRAKYATCKDPYIYFGRTVLGVDDKKVPSLVTMRCGANVNGAQLSATVVDEAGNSVSAFTTAGADTSKTASLTSLAATESLEVRLAWDSEFTTLSPAGKTVYDVRLDAWPSPRRVQRLQLPLVIAAEVETLDGGVYGYASPQDEVDALMTLSSPSGRAVVDVQLGTETWQMVVDDVDFRPTAPVPPESAPSVREWAGMCLVTLSRGLD